MNMEIELVYKIFCYVFTLLVTIGCFSLILKGYRALQKKEEQEWERQLKQFVEKIQ